MDREGMSEEEDEKPKKGGCVSYIVIYGCLFGFLSLLVIGTPIIFLFQGAWLLATGWVTFAVQNLPKARLDSDLVLTALLSGSLATILLHSFARWFAGAYGREWKVKWTAGIMLLLALMFATAVCMAGSVHQVGWLFRERLVEKIYRVNMDKHNLLHVLTIGEELSIEITPDSKDEEITQIGARETSLDRIHRLDRKLWVHRNPEGKISALLIVPNSWEKTMSDGFVLVRIGENASVSERPGSEISQWLEGRRVL